jgi:hypothetical protein
MAFIVDFQTGLAYIVTQALIAGVVTLLDI